MISRLVVKAALVGFAASVAVAAPAHAATKLTLDPQTKKVIGFSPAVLTGDATPGATVRLWESAFVFNDLQPAEDYSNNRGPVTAVANAQGRWTISRDMDSGFLWQVRSGDEVSEIRKFEITQLPAFSNAAATGNNAVTVRVFANPAQPWLKAHLQKQINSKWTSIAEGYTSEPVDGVGGGDVTLNATGVSGGQGLFRVFVEGDDKNGVLEGASADTFSLNVPGAVTDPKPTTPAPTPTTPKPTPTTPKPTPTTPKPTTPAPAVPAIGSVQFTRIQYDSPGTDSGSNGSLNTEWAKLTNKSKATINLNGWTVRDSGNHVYKFTGTVNLKPGQSIFVLSGKGTNNAAKKYWGRTGKAGYIWNNPADVAYLRTPTGRQIDTCIWKTLGSGYTNC